MIDLNDEKQKYYYLGKCISRQPINFYTEKLYHPEVGDIFEMGEDSYRELLMPFVIPIQYYRHTPSDMTVYEAIMNDNDMYILLVQSLMYFLKLKIQDDEGKVNIRPYTIKDKKTGRERNQIIIKDKLMIDDEKFNDLKTLMLMICNTKELTEEDFKVEKNISNQIKDEEYKSKFENLFKNRKKEKTKTEKRVKLVNVYDYIVHCQENINYDEPLKWSVYQLYNSYQNLHKKESIHFTYAIASNGMLDSKEKLKSLSEEIIK